MADHAVPATAPLRWAGLLIGFALGGFFDGILLHQVLQWHHLLSNVDAVRDVRAQVFFDGLFHALMYAVAVIALWKLWRARHALAAPGAGARLGGLALMGFGAWHGIDALLSHWLTGIHRIRMDSAHPLAWDLFWFLAFGVLPFLAGWRLAARGRGRDGGGGGRPAAAGLGLAVVLAGPIAALPAADAPEVVVLFAPGVSSGQAFNALARVDARVVWVDGSGGLWAVRMDDPRRAWQLYRQGAVMVGNAGVALGCLAWTRTSASPVPALAM